MLVQRRLIQELPSCNQWWMVSMLNSVQTPPPTPRIINCEKKRDDLVNEVEEFANRWKKLVEDDGEKRMGALYEQLQVRLEAINTDLSLLQVSEEELQKFVSLTRSYSHQSLLSIYYRRVLSSPSLTSSPRLPRMSRRMARRCKDARCLK